MADTLDLGTLSGRLAISPTEWITGLAKGESATLGFKGKALLAFGAVGAGATAVGVALYKVGDTFDEVADTISVATGGSAKDVDALVESAKRIGSEIPVSFDAIGPVVAMFNKRLGLTGPALEKLSSQVLAYGKATGEALDPAVVSEALGAYGVKGKDASAMLDDLYRTSRATQVPLSELLGLTQKGAPNLTRFGLGIDAAANLMGTMQAKGVDSGRVVQGLSRAAGEFAKQGIPMKKGLTDAVAGVEELLAKGDTAGATNLATKLFSARGAGPFIQAVKSGALSVDVLTKKTKTQGQGILAAEKNTRDFSEQFQLFKNRALVAVEPLATRVFNALGEGMAWVNAVGVPALMSLGDEFSAVGVFISGAIAWLQSLAGEGDKTGAKVSQLAATISSVWASIRQIFQSYISIVLSLWNAFGSTIVSYVRSSLTNALTVIRGVFNIIAGIFKTVAALLKGDWAGVWAGIQQIVRGAVGVLRGLVSQLWNIIRTAFRAGGIALRAIFSGIWSGIRSLAASGVEGVVAMVRGIPAKLRALMGSFGSAGKALIRSFITGLSAAGGIAADFASAIWQAVKAVINSGIDRLNGLLTFTINPPGPGPTFTVKGGQIPHLMAAGGYVDKATLAVIGEAGPEVVVPLSGRNGANARNALGMGGPVGSDAKATLTEEDRNLLREFTEAAWAIADRDIQLAVSGRQAGKIYAAGEREAKR